MLNAWWLNSSQGPVVVCRRGATPTGERTEALPRASSVRLLDAWLRDGSNRRRLLEIAQSLGGPRFHALNPVDPRVLGQLRARLQRAFELGQLEAYALRREPVATSSLGSPAKEEEPQPYQPDARADTHWVEFAFIYPDGTPARGYEYKLTDPDGESSNGRLDAEATIHRDNARLGIYAVALKDIESVTWEPRQVRCGESATVLAAVTGFADGAPAKVRVFREFSEGDDEVIATIDATVQGGKIECSWRYDYTADDASKAEQGIVRFVAEVSLENGAYWRRTGRKQLPVQLKTLAQVRFASPLVRDGEHAEVVVTARGYEAGTEVALELWVLDPCEGERKLADLPSVTLEGDTARAAIPYRQSSDPDAQLVEAAVIQHAGEYFVRAVIEDDVRRAGRTGLVACEPAESVRLSA